MNKKILFIGCGNMGEPVLKAFLNVGVSPSDIFIKTKTKESSKNLSKKYSVNVYESKNQNHPKGNPLSRSNRDPYQGDFPSFDVVILAVKPQKIEEVDFSEISMSDDVLIISLLAGKEINKLKEITGKNKIVRVMPNLPLIVGKGMTTFFAEGLSIIEKEFIKSVFSKSGEVIELESEDDMHIATLMAGSMPGIFYYLCSILEDITNEYGFTKEQSQQLIKEAFIGSAELLNQSNETFKDLQERVSSKGGITETTTNEMEKLGIMKVFKRAIERGVDKSKKGL